MGADLNQTWRAGRSGPLGSGSSSGPGPLSEDTDGIAADKDLIPLGIRSDQRTEMRTHEHL